MYVCVYEEALECLLLVLEGTCVAVEAWNENRDERETVDSTRF